MCEYLNMDYTTDFYLESCYLSSSVPVELMRHGEVMSLDHEGGPEYAYGPPT